MRSFDAVYCIGVPRVTEFQTDAEIEASWSLMEKIKGGRYRADGYCYLQMHRWRTAGKNQNANLWTAVIWTPWPEHAFEDDCSNVSKCFRINGLSEWNRKKEPLQLIWSVGCFQLTYTADGSFIMFFHEWCSSRANSFDRIVSLCGSKLKTQELFPLPNG